MFETACTDTSCASKTLFSMAVKICGIQTLITELGTLVSSKDVGASCDDNADELFTSDVQFVGIKQRPLNESVCSALRRESWCLLHHVPVPLSLEFYRDLQSATFEFGSFLNDTRTSSVSSCLLGKFRSSKLFFSLDLYRDFAVSRSASENGDCRLYLSISNILSQWDTSVFETLLNESDVTSISYALSQLVGKKEPTLELSNGTQKALYRYVLAFRSALPDSYLRLFSYRSKYVAFYPYKTLKLLGFPPVVEFEGMIKNNFLGIVE